MNLGLVCIGGESKGLSWPFQGGVMVMGREPRCDIVLHDPIASRRHCQLIAEADSVLFEDLGGRTPVLVNGVPRKRATLEPGDEIALGRERFLVAGLPEETRATSGKIEPDETHSWGQGDHVSLQVESAEPPTEATPSTVHDLALLHTITRNLSATDTVPGLVAALRGWLTRRFEPQTMWIALVHREQELTFLDPEQDTSHPVPGKTVLEIIRRALREGQGLLLLHRHSTDGEQQLEFSMACPVQLHGENLAVVVMQVATPTGSYDEDDLRFLVLLTQSLAPIIHATTDLDRLRLNNVQLRIQTGESLELVGRSRVIVRLRAQIDEAARVSSNVLVTGETGTGKELVARLIHTASSRHAQPMVVVNCAAIPRELFAGAVFGHEKGAFTGADRASPGFIAQAHGGVLFLDEIADLTVENQAALLRVIETGAYHRVGGERERHVDARILAATNKDVQKAINDGSFRADLYHRLNEIEIDVPPLRKRFSDVPVLAQHFFELGRGLGKRPLEGIAPEALGFLKSRDWPGNVRELRNHVRRAIQTAQQPVVGVEDLGGQRSAPQVAKTEEQPISLQEAERHHLLEALAHSNGNVRQAAQVLDISRSTLYRKIAAHRIHLKSPSQD